jgi:acetyl-CoA carboxylase carboxyltransferase component
MSSTQKHWLNELISEFKNQEEVIKQGGGTSRIEKEHAKGKLTARERINKLVDKGSRFFELGLWAGYEMYDEVGGCPAGGVITGIGEVSGRTCMIGFLLQQKKT